MTVGARNRTFLNTLVIYGRGLLMLVTGLFSSRWVLGSLQAEGYGLYTLMAGVAGVVAFVIVVVGRSTGRFLAVAVGEGRNVRAWFNTAVTVHVLLTLVVLGVGCPLSAWVVRHWLDVPAARMDDCVKVVCLILAWLCAGTMAAPWQGMFAARGRIGEAAAWGFLYPVVNFSAAAWMVTHTGDWLVFYPGALAAGIVIEQIGVCLMAMYKFADCRIVWHEMWDGPRIRRLLGFSGWQFWNDVGDSLGVSGLSVLVNKLCGPVLNAGAGVGRTVVTHVDSLANSFGMVYAPLIANSAGSGSRDEVIRLAYRSTYLSAAFFLVFAIPLSVELPRILALWLKEVPAGAVVAVAWFMGAFAANEASKGFDQAVAAKGRVAQYFVVCGILQAMTLVAGFTGWKFGFGFGGVFAGVCAVYVILAFARAWMARRLVGTNVWTWFSRVVLPLLLATLLALTTGFLIKSRGIGDSAWLAPLTACVGSGGIFALLALLMIPNVRSSLDRGRVLALSVHFAPYRAPVLRKLAEQQRIVLESRAIFGEDGGHVAAEFETESRPISGVLHESQLGRLGQVILALRLLWICVLSRDYDCVLWPQYAPWWTTLPLVIGAVLGRRYGIALDTTSETGGWTARTIKRFLFRRACVLWVPGSKSRRYLQTSYGVPEAKIVEGCYIPEMPVLPQMTRRCSQTTFLMVANDIPRRRIDALVAGFREFAAARDDVRLVLCGKGTSRYACPVIETREGVAYRQLSHLYAMADVYVHNGDEQFSVALLLAAMLGIPFVSGIEVGVCADLEGVGMRVENWQQTQGWAAGFSEAMRQRENWQEMGHAATEKARRFSIEKTAEALGRRLS